MMRARLPEDHCLSRCVPGRTFENDSDGLKQGWRDSFTEAMQCMIERAKHAALAPQKLCHPVYVADFVLGAMHWLAAAADSFVLCPVATCNFRMSWIRPSYQ